ncbi:hypothetical protein MMC25_000252 [Agyrium rufum]|nr:hypothetical protein [Agyrium rufum]
MKDRVRLHISPLNPNLLVKVLPPPLLQDATNISYHDIQTFPDRAYGYVELPAAEAEKLKKKLNGAILRGAKMRVEEARPSRKRKHISEVGGQDEGGAEVNAPKEAGSDDKDRKKRKGKTQSQENDGGEKRQKQKRKEGVLPGVELPDGRKVKRGWAEPASKDKLKKDRSFRKTEKVDEKKLRKKKAIVATYTDGPECLFKTKLPPNAGLSTKKSKLGKEGETKKSKSKRGSEREVTVHEFENTQKFSSFLKDSGAKEKAKGVKEFVEEKGWVDEDGNLVEEVKPSRRKNAKKLEGGMPGTAAQENMTGLATSSKVPPESTRASTREEGGDQEDDLEDDATSSSGDSDSEEDSNDELESDVLSDAGSGTDFKVEATVLAPNLPIDGFTGISEQTNVSNLPTFTLTPSPRPPSRSSLKEVSPHIEEAKPQERVIHPLEALFKRPPPSSEATNAGNSGSKSSSNLFKAKSTARTSQRPAPLEVPKAEAAFSFFETGDKDDNDDDKSIIPGSETSPASGTTLTARPKRNLKRLALKMVIPPQTPFTQMDFQRRGLRSAAPTPDTAAPNRNFFDVRSGEKLGGVDEESDEDESDDAGNEKATEKEGESGDDGENDSYLATKAPALNDPAEGDSSVEEEEDDDEQDDGDNDNEKPTAQQNAKAQVGQKAKGKGEGKEGEETEFSKWFWANRGDNNRAWKKRRRDVKREIRRRRSHRGREGCEATGQDGREGGLYD